MAKITALTAITGATIADGDQLPVVDVSDPTQAASGTTKSITAAELGAAVGANGRMLLGEFTSAPPAAPTAGVKLFAQKRARRLPAYVGPGGRDNPLQPFMGSTAIANMTPTPNSAVITQEGMALTANGTAAAAAAWAGTNIRTAATRVSYNSAATAGAAGGVREAVLNYWRGNVAGLGGFHFVARFGFNAIPATRRWFVGLYSLTTVPGNTDPSAFVNMLGVGQDAADTLIRFMHNDGAGVATKGDSGIASPTTSDLLEVRIYCKPNDTKVQMSVEKLNGGAAAVEYDTGVSTDIPANTLGLALHLWCNNSTTAAIMGLDVAGIYTERDF